MLPYVLGFLALVADSTFKMVVNTANAGSASDTFVLPCFGSGYDAVVDWGDSTTTTLSGTPGNVSRVYASPGTYIISITESSVGGFPTIRFNNGGDRLKLTQISNWGSNKWISWNRSFYGCANLQITAPDFATANTGFITDLNFAFWGCSAMTSFPLLNLAAGNTHGSAWRDCSGLTSFPLILTPLGTDFSACWNGCTGLTSFPALYTVSSSNFEASWQGCTGLTSFPTITVGTCDNFKNTWNGCTGLGGFAFPALNFVNMQDGTNCFLGWAMSTSAYNTILVNLNTVNVRTGVTFSGGNSVASGAGITARTALRARAPVWVITDGGP